MLKAVVPYEITDANIDATNIATEPSYSAGANYTFEADFVLGADGLLYQYIGATGTTHDSPTTAGQTDWTLKGPRNALRPFDIQKGVNQESVIGTQAERTDNITYTLSGLGRVMGIGFINVEAETISVVITETTTGDILNETYTLPDLANYGSSFYAYLNFPILPETELVIFDLNAPPGCTFDITISNPSKTAKVGAIVMGLAQELGQVMLEPSWGLRRFSVYDADRYRRTLIRIEAGEHIDLELSLLEGGARRVQKVLEGLDGVAALYQPSAQFPEYTVYGVLGDNRITGKTHKVTFMQLKIEGL